ncbi:hypothetical protein [Algoriphagus halophytocola]|uniref:Uncharacterized protein n=1 Tax=Algoriphagus halophytocola TaxID=2991499 RepID=A0ABY6MIX3_9BACT|nr:hypothetical protein [Algoriphagus sp. TR-M5]UZD22990.1 hypothetical protein OM944_00550 [Algoriphagus sp. TR-M5]
MVIRTSTASFMIEGSDSTDGCINIRCTSQVELYRFFGSVEIKETGNTHFPYLAKSCKQEFANALILMVKEIDYSEFSEFSMALA